MESADERAKLYLASFDLFFRHVAETQTPGPGKAVTPEQARLQLQEDYDSDAESVASLVSHSLAYVKEVAAIDDAAGRIIRAAKQRYRVASPGAGQGGRVPHAPPELKELQDRKDALIEETLWSIEKDIGPAQLRNIGYWLMGRVSRQTMRGK